MRNNPRQRRPSTYRGSGGGGGGLLSALAAANAGAPAMSNQMVPADIMATPAEPMPMGYSGPVNAPTPYTGPAMYYSDNGQIVDQPFSDRRSWFDKFRGVPDSAGQANFQIQSQVAQQRALAPLELADAQESMRALAKVRQELHPQELAMQQAEAGAKAAQERLNAEAKLKQDRALGVAATPNEGFNSKNPGDVDFNYKGDPSEILDQPFIPYGQGAFDNQKYASDQSLIKNRQLALDERLMSNPGYNPSGQIQTPYRSAAPFSDINAEGRLRNIEYAKSNRPIHGETGGSIYTVDPNTGRVTLQATASPGRVIPSSGYDTNTGQPLPDTVIKPSFVPAPRVKANIPEDAINEIIQRDSSGGGPILPPELMTGGQELKKYSGQRAEYVTGLNNSQVQTSQGGAPKTPPPRITELEGPALEGAIPDYLRKKKQQATVVYDAAGRAIQTMRTDAQKKWEEEQQRLRDIFSPYIRVAPKK